ncbi:hypothetical protein BGZ50_009509 [Haplosporangium sp. Z 11]|nr:hypothetical protein BGZ50_009509 [Haplosporangium sp. Z 11]
MSQPVAQQVAFAFCKTIAKAALEQIWKPRCAAVTEWESTINIIQRQKRTRVCPDDVEDKGGFNADGLDDFCDCGRRIHGHADDAQGVARCPGAETKSQADEALF